MIAALALTVATVTLIGFAEWARMTLRQRSVRARLNSSLPVLPRRAAAPAPVAGPPFAGAGASSLTATATPAVVAAEPAGPRVSQRHRDTAAPGQGGRPSSTGPGLTAGPGPAGTP